MKRKSGLWVLMLAALAVMAGLGGCSSNDAGLTGPAMPQADVKGSAGEVTGAGANGGADIVDTAIGAGSFTTLVAAVQAAGLEGALRGEGPFTVFAPTDEAFEKLPAGTVESLLKPENKDKLVAILTYHVVPGKVKAADVVKVKSAKTVQGQSVKVDASNGVKINDAKVEKADIDCSNGVIHVIDTVLLPKEE